MKYFFKYEFGYINIDDENLYMTNSGNWSETKDLLEKSSKSIKKNTIRKTKVYGFYFLIICIGLLVLLNFLKNVDTKFNISIGLVLFLLAAYNFMKSEQGSKYKIPLSKIDKMEYSYSNLKIHFKNLDNKEDFERIENIEDKGIKILKELGLIKKET